MEVIRAIISLFLTFISVFNIFDGPNEVRKPQTKENFTYLEYPEEAIINPSDAGLSLSEFMSRADDDGDDAYVNAQGYEDINGIIDSPYFTVHIENKKIPVYATSAFVGNTQKGVLHSFCEIYVDTSKSFNLSFQLNSHGFIMDTVKIMPSSNNLKTIFRNTVLNTEITELGTYTFVFNDTDQEHGFTLFVKELVDEDKEIADLQNQGYNVVVVEKGLHNQMPCYDFYGTSNTVYYLKRGAYLLAKHTYDITSENDDYYDTSKQDTDMLNANHLPIGLTRCPYINLTCCSNVKILGNGVIDLSHLDRRERRGIVLAYSNNVEIDGIKIINSPEWSFITYDCENLTIKNVDIFGYRMNADAFAICNTRNATIDNSFCRTGDDLFDVKALGGSETAVSNNITFTNCTAWNGKARCFGICGEVMKDISNVTFKDSCVVFHDATWNEDRIPALAIIVEAGSTGSISNITYENIEIHKAYSRAIGCLIYDEDNTVNNVTVSDIKYKNIRYNSAKPNKLASNGNTTNSISAEFENVYANGYKITQVDSTNFVTDSYATVTVK